MPDDFYGGTDWQSSSGPIITRAMDASADLWPHGLASEAAGGNKDVLVDGLHPILAIGPQADPNRVSLETGVVVTYNAANDRAEVNIAIGNASKQYVANILSYGPVVYSATYAIGQPVYVDDSDNLTAGCTLSLSPLNVNGLYNPLAGILWYDQDEYDDSYVGGAGAATAWPKAASAVALVESLLTVLKTR